MLRDLGRFRPTGPARTLATTVALVALVVSVAACGTTGRSMREPEPGATAPPRRADATSTIAGFNTLIPEDLFSLTSPAFAPGGDIPSEYTCDGAGTSPPLAWGNVPPGTVELVLVVTDPDADSFIHWMVVGIDPGSTQNPAAVAPAGAVQLNSTTGTPAYAPLCPPPGPAHTYEFTLYALTEPSGLTPAAETRAAASQVASNAAATALLTGSYARTTAN